MTPGPVPFGVAAPCRSGCEFQGASALHCACRALRIDLHCAGLDARLQGIARHPCDPPMHCQVWLAGAPLDPRATMLPLGATAPDPRLCDGVLLLIIWILPAYVRICKSNFLHASEPMDMRAEVCRWGW